jgi:predicted P-loop ATPase
VFVGTTNQEEFLADETGNRRWLPVMVGRQDISAIKRDRPQLWAEARDRYQNDGIQWRGAEALGRAQHVHHMVHDPWETSIVNWLDTKDWSSTR